ncbi:MAG: BioY protein [Anaerosporomusa subterranea]|jgi:biotin transport system substrate-specific component|nr:BioY protein [Anaerosporomusa subterranea]
MSERSKVTDFVYAAMFAALTAVLGLISIPLPFSPVPVSGQSLGIMLAGSILTVKQAAFSVLTFVLIGAVGVPVFSGLTGGLGILIGPRGGYYLGFLVGAIVIALLRGQSSNPWRLALANLIGGIGVVYLFGVAWLSVVTGMSLEKAVMAGALPFIPGDLFKVFAASAIGTAINKRLHKSRP